MYSPQIFYECNKYRKKEDVCLYLRETERKRSGKEEEKKSHETIEKDKINSIEF